MTLFIYAKDGKIRVLDFIAAKNSERRMETYADIGYGCVSGVCEDVDIVGVKQENKMKTQQLLDLINSGVKPVVVFTGQVESGDYDVDAGMMARVVGYNSVDKWDKDNSTVMLEFDMREFADFNLSKMRAHYYDSEGVARLKWAETDHYPKDHIDSVCEMLIERGEEAELILMKIAEPNKYLEAFLNQIDIKDYPTYLEHLLNQK